MFHLKGLQNSQKVEVDLDSVKKIAPPKPIMVLAKEFLQNLANYKSTSTFCVERGLYSTKKFHTW